MVYHYSGYKFSCAAVAKGTKCPDKIQNRQKTTLPHGRAASDFNLFYAADLAMLCQILVAGREVVLVSDAYHGALVAQNGYIRMGHIYGNFHIIVGLYDLAGLGVDFHNAGAILIMYLAVIGSGALRPGQRLDAINNGVDAAQCIEEP